VKVIGAQVNTSLDFSRSNRIISDDIVISQDQAQTSLERISPTTCLEETVQRMQRTQAMTDRVLVRFLM
jgi:hypothetical protein